MKLPKNTKRVQIPKKLKKEVYKKTNCRCARCGAHLMSMNAEKSCDHIIPVCMGGRTDLKNLIGLCKSCNEYKDDNLYLPSTFYHDIGCNSQYITEANKMVINWIRRHITYVDVLDNPFIFDELGFTFRYTDTLGYQVFDGYYEKGTKYLSMYKLEPNEIEDAIENIPFYSAAGCTYLSNCKYNPVYVFCDSDKSIQFTIEINIVSDTLLVKIHQCKHKRIYANVLNNIINLLHTCWKAVGINRVIIKDPYEMFTEEFISKASLKASRIKDNVHVRF